MHAVAAPACAGFCWDIGHAFWNVTHGKMDLQAPTGFVAGVIHTHLHDLAADGQTHWPFSEGRVPLATYLEALRGVGYQGVFNLEMYPRGGRRSRTSRRASYKASVWWRLARRGKPELDHEPHEPHEKVIGAYHTAPNFHSATFR